MKKYYLIDDKCSKCGSNYIGTYQYGFPNLKDEKIKSRIERGEIRLGGCKVSALNPKYYCRECGTKLYMEDKADNKEGKMQQKSTIKEKYTSISHELGNIAKSKILDTVEATQHVIKDGTDYTKEKVSETIDEYKRSKEPISLSNWYGKAAKSCEDITDSILGEDRGTSQKITKAFAGKLGAVGTSVGIFSIASILGTASTGTAIGSLSGAAFTSASLAWLGGSVVMGSAIIGVMAIAGGIGAALGAGWVFKKYVYGKKRERSELSEKELKIIDVCLSLATAFRREEEAGNKVDPITAKALYADALQPLCEDLLEYKTKTESWTYLAQKRFKDTLNTFEDITAHLKEFSDKNPNVSVGIISAVTMQLLSDDLGSFNTNETLVLEAIRRLNGSYTNATNEELAEYVQSLKPEQLPGFQSAVKGIYHELRFVSEENSDGDEYIAEIFDATNHAGADVILTNTVTGEIREIQLKATDYLSYIKRHNERYADIDVFATEEVANSNASIESTGALNSGLTDDVSDVVGTLKDSSDSIVASSMTIAAMVTLARNAKVLLRGESMSKIEKEEMIKGGTISAGLAGIVSLLIG